MNQGQNTWQCKNKPTRRTMTVNLGDHRDELVEEKLPNNREVRSQTWVTSTNHKVPQANTNNPATKSVFTLGNQRDPKIQPINQHIKQPKQNHSINTRTAWQAENHKKEKAENYFVDCNFVAHKWKPQVCVECGESKSLHRAAANEPPQPFQPVEQVAPQRQNPPARRFAPVRPTILKKVVTAPVKSFHFNKPVEHLLECEKEAEKQSSPVRISETVETKQEAEETDCLFTPHLWKPLHCTECGKPKSIHTFFRLQDLPHDETEEIDIKKEEKKPLHSFFQQPRMNLQKEQSKQEEVNEKKIENFICCFICFDEFPESQMFQCFSHCIIEKHIDADICKACYGKFIEIEIKEKNNISKLTCPITHCGAPLKYREMRKLKDSGAISQQLFNNYDGKLRRAEAEKKEGIVIAECEFCKVEQFVSPNENKVWYCRCWPVPQCLSCKVGHPGITCKEYYEMRNLVDRAGLSENWIKNNTKSCPNCKVTIYKDGGCNKVHCTKCNSAICWHCAISFDTDDACYSHLRQEHGGYY